MTSFMIGPMCVTEDDFKQQLKKNGLKFGYIKRLYEKWKDGDLTYFRIIIEGCLFVIVTDDENSYPEIQEDSENEIDEAVVKYINCVSGQKIEFSDEIHFTENGERFHKVTFDGALGLVYRNIAYVIGFVLEKREEAERAAELKIRNLGLPNIPQLTIHEEIELIELQEKIKLRTTPINKLEPRIELLF